MVPAALPSYDGGNPDRLIPIHGWCEPTEPAALVRHEHLKEVEVPLSEHEQRMLKEIESALYADDPKFASSVRKTGATGARRPAGLVVALAILGVALLIGGLALDFKPGGFPVLSLVGFLVMFAAGVLALRSTPSHGVAGAKGTGGPRVPGTGRTSAKPADGRNYSSRMEDRFRRRFDQEP